MRGTKAVESEHVRNRVEHANVTEPLSGKGPGDAQVVAELDGSTNKDDVIFADGGAEVSRPMNM